MFTYVVFLFFCISNTFLILIALMLFFLKKFCNYYLLFKAKKYNKLK